MAAEDLAAEVLVAVVVEAGKNLKVNFIIMTEIIEFSEIASIKERDLLLKKIENILDNREIKIKISVDLVEGQEYPFKIIFYNSKNKAIMIDTIKDENYFKEIINIFELDKLK